MSGIDDRDILQRAENYGIVESTPGPDGGGSAADATEMNVDGGVHHDSEGGIATSSGTGMIDNSAGINKYGGSVEANANEDSASNDTKRAASRTAPAWIGTPAAFVGGVGGL